MTRIIEHRDRAPLQLKKAEMAGESVWLCRCGLSQNQPYCDSSHKATRDETVGVLYRYRRREERLEREAVTVEAVPAPTIYLGAGTPSLDKLGGE